MRNTPPHYHRAAIGIARPDITRLSLSTTVQVGPTQECAAARVAHRRTIRRQSVTQSFVENPDIVLPTAAHALYAGTYKITIAKNLHGSIGKYLGARLHRARQTGRRLDLRALQPPRP